MLKQKRIVAVICLAMVLSILCFVKIGMPNQQYHYSAEVVFDNGIAESDVIVYENIQIPAGVYDVQLHYQSDTSNKNYCTMVDPEVYSGGLLTNGEVLHKYLDATDYRMWLYEGTDTLQVSVNYGGEGKLLIEDLYIQETNALWTMCLTCIWALAMFFVFCFAFSDYDREVGITKEKKADLSWCCYDCICCLRSVFV